MESKKSVVKQPKPSLWSEMTKSWVHVVFCILITGALMSLIPFHIKCVEYATKMIEQKPADYEWLGFDQFLPAVYLCPIYATIQYFSVKALVPLISPWCKIQDNLDERAKRGQKMSTCFFNMLIYTWLTIWGYMQQKDSYYLPAMLGGKGELHLTLTNLPYPPKIPGFQEYYMGQLGWHFSSICRMFFLEGLRPDTVEMSLHHFITIYLIMGSSFINCKHIGGIILFLHDTNNILVCMWRFANELPYKRLVQLITVSLILAWIYFRIYCLVRISYFMWTTDAANHCYMVEWFQPVFSVLVTILLFLHAFWLRLIMQIFIAGILKGEQEDISTNYQNGNVGKAKIAAKKE